VPQLIVFIICTALLLPMSVASEEALTAEEIASQLEHADSKREKSVQGFSITRRYSLSNQRGDKVSVTNVEFTYGPNAQMTFSILGETGSEGLFRYVIRKIVQSEVDNSAVAQRSDSRMSLKNYTFRVLGSEIMQGRSCHVLEANPRRKSKFLIAGDIWVDAQEYAVVRLEGRPAANVSFWARKAYVVQHFRKLGDYWVLDRNHSTVEARILGKLELNVLLQPSPE